MRTMIMMVTTVIALTITLLMVIVVDAVDSNPIFDPCTDAKVQKSDGFSFGLAFSSKESFFQNQIQLSPCDHRLPLSSTNAQLAVFRPNVDEISLLTINSGTFSPQMHGGHMVAFAGRKYAARSIPVFVADSNHIITSFTLVLEFDKGTLQNLFWKKDGCAKCSGKSSFICLDDQGCAIQLSSCKSQGGSVDCSIGIQLAFSGTDKNDKVLNSWYEVKNIRQYSLFGLYSDLKDSLTSQFNNII
ncbi:uncharacterized protein LOC122086364 [Macadamia integrifolia]|uniref:uncharacterized protein LOC122086364 n=1 Tax=Macadamia integrifolia TaxID=60698 RepID=UPI001C4E5E25|nr:uncharacterized protein LOC122086364 [Macadamia integrifolia]XP_042511062.1 uncharacterized protein LOC122086364 [Macadamia integrifolia]XP_042511063.1 uncharacterized protein LOC122086364 [Macadamia integrifolia]